MKKTVYFPEIFEEVGNAETKEEKIADLHKYKNEKGMYNILHMCYDPNIKWLITLRDIENLTYEQMDIDDYDLAPTTLFLESNRRLYNFTDRRQPPLKKSKILRLIANMFSVLHHNEVELFKQMVDGHIEETGITVELLKEAFPGLISEESVIEEFTTPSKEEQVGKGTEIDNLSEVSEADNTPPEPPKKKHAGGKKSKLDKNKKQILKMIEDNVTRKVIAKKYKTSLPNLYKWLRKNRSAKITVDKED